MHLFRQKPFFALLLLSLVLGFSFMGSRSLFEPDEGRYTNVALTIADTNEWISLYRHPASLHFTKPPLTYWMMAASVKTFGLNTWAVRLPIALAYIFCILMIYQLGKAFCREKPWLPALIFATSPLPFLASNYISTDFVLAACETLALLCFSQYVFLKKSKFWLDGMWASFGLAFLAKGPPGLLPLLVVVVLLWQQGDWKSLFRPIGFLAFAIIGLGWYGIVVQRHPGLFDYFIGHEVIARVSDESLRRNPEWYGPLVIFLPTLLLGAIPWLVAAVTVAIANRGQAARTEAKFNSPENIESRFLWLWLLLPLLIFCLSRSRMPLYLLPLFTPISLLLARGLVKVNFNARTIGILLAIWIGALVTVRYGTSLYQGNKDPEVFAKKVLAITKEAPREIIFVEDMARYGLHLYLDSQINKVSFKQHPKAISDSQFDMTLKQALKQTPGKRIFVFKRGNEQYFKNALNELNIVPIFLGSIPDIDGDSTQDRLIYTIPGEFERFRIAR